jgi:hypothetical protein
MIGVVKTRHLITHPRTIVHEFGMGCYLRCVWRTVAKRGPVTFLECVEVCCTHPVPESEAVEAGAHAEG